jgi:DNA repair protein RecO (recombination protein O)
MDTEALGRVVGENHPVVEFERLVEDLTEEVWIQPEIDDDLVGRLRDAADIRVAGTEAGGVDLNGLLRLLFAHESSLVEGSRKERGRERYRTCPVRATGFSRSLHRGSAPDEDGAALMEITDAILLRKTKLTETSLIVTWLTSSHGKLKTVAKGARQAKSRFAGRLDLFFTCEIQWARSRKSELHGLHEVELKEPHDALRRDLDRVRLASYFVELIELVTEADHPVPELYDLLSRGLRHVNESGPSLRALEHFERELARTTGILQPAVSAAVAIGRAYHKLPVVRADLVKRLKETNEQAVPEEPRESGL